ncbi:MAG: helix-turn-helix domain-containing protein [Pseudomonadota bacterium]
MANQTDRTRRSISTLLHVLKIMERDVPTAHDRFKSHPSDIGALHFIGDNPGCQARALADHLGVAATTVSSLLDRLERAGLIARERPPENRRAIALSLSVIGLEVRDAIISEELDNAKRILAALPRGRREEFVSSLETIAARLSQDET